MSGQKKERGSIELVVLGLLAALIVVLAIPALKQFGSGTKVQLKQLATEVNSANPEPVSLAGQGG